MFKKLLCLTLSFLLTSPVYAMKKGMKINPHQKIEESKESDSTDSIDSFEFIESEQPFDQNPTSTENMLPLPPTQIVDNNLQLIRLAERLDVIEQR